MYLICWVPILLQVVLALQERIALVRILQGWREEVYARVHVYVCTHTNSLSYGD